MECQACSERLTAFVDGELEPSEMEDVENHLGSCDQCRDEHDSLLRVWDLVDSWASLLEIEPPRWARIESRISGASGRFWDFGWLLAPGWSLAAATLLLLLIAVPMFYAVSGEQADLSRMFMAFIAERDRQESIHEGIFDTEPVGWVSYNPFAARANSVGRNPFIGE